MAQRGREACKDDIKAKRGLLRVSFPQQKAQLLGEIGAIYQTELDEPKKALAAYSDALELTPDDRALLQKVLDLYTETKKWKQAVATLKRVIALEPDAKQKAALLRRLGDIYQTHLDHSDSAIQAYQVAQQLDPEEVAVDEPVVEAGTHDPSAIEDHMQVLRAEPFRFDAYHALRRSYIDAHQYDKAWCVCHALVFMKKAEREEEEFHEQYQPRGLAKAKAKFTGEAWGALVLPDENRYISAILAASWESVAAMKALPHKRLGINRKDRRPLASDPLMFSKLFYYVAQLLDVTLPDVFLVEDDKPGGIVLANAIEKAELCPAALVRRNHLEGKSEREIAFLSARVLTFMRPEYYLKTLIPTKTELELVVLSAIVMVRPDFPVPPDKAQLLQQYIPELRKRISRQVLAQLDAVVGRLVAAAPKINLAKWGHAVDAVSHRVGFVVCGDLEVAARMVSVEPIGIGDRSVKDRITELVLYAISEPYFALRARLGFAIAV